MEIAVVLVIAFGAVALFASEKLPVDYVAMLVLGAVLVSGLVTPAEAVSGFSNPATVTVAAMFILSAGMQKTGALKSAARLFYGLAGRPLLLLVALMLTSGIVSAFINNTAAVAVFLPLVLALCSKHKIAASKLLIPLSFASQFGGACTLIGTSTNLLVNSIGIDYGMAPIGLFEFAPMGLVFSAGGLLYFMTIGRWLLPDREDKELTQSYGLAEYISELRVPENSPLVGKNLRSSTLGTGFDATVIEIHRGKEVLWAAPEESIRAGDVLLIRAGLDNMLSLAQALKLESHPGFKLADESLAGKDMVLVEAMISPRSRLIGRTLAGVGFSHRYRAIVLALQRRGQTLTEKLSRLQLAFGDTLLLQAAKTEIERLRRDEDFILLDEVETSFLRQNRAHVSLLIMAGVVGLAALGILPILSSAILGVICLIGTRCISLQEAYDAVDWRVIFLLAGILPLGIALQKSGTALWIADQAVLIAGGFGPLLMLALLYLLTACLTEFMSNNASAVLLTPIAIATGYKMGIDPKPLVMAVTFAASTSFATPVGYQTNTMVYGPGGYRFTDFMKVGIPLNLLFWLLAVLFIPVFWPFQ